MPHLKTKGSSKSLNMHKENKQRDGKAQNRSSKYLGKNNVVILSDTEDSDEELFLNPKAKHYAVATKTIMRKQVRTKTPESENKVYLDDPYFEFESDGTDLQSPAPALSASKPVKAPLGKPSKPQTTRGFKGRYLGTYNYHSTRHEDSWIDDDDIDSSDSGITSSSDPESDSDASMDSDYEMLTDDEYDLDIDME